MKAQKVRFNNNGWRLHFSTHPWPVTGLGEKSFLQAPRVSWLTHNLVKLSKWQEFQGNSGSLLALLGDESLKYILLLCFFTRGTKQSKSCINTLCRIVFALQGSIKALMESAYKFWYKTTHCLYLGLFEWLFK